MVKSAKKSAVPAVATAAVASVPSVSVVAAKAKVAPVPALATVAVAPVSRKAIPLTATITVVATVNPKRPGTIAASKFPIYYALRDAAKGKAFTVADLVKAFAAKGYPARRAFSALRFDGERSFIEVRDGEALVIAPRKAR